MKAIFIRHGESTGNAGVPCHDLATIELTELGQEQAREVAAMSCPLLSGPSTITVWTKEGTTNACEEAQARGDHREAA